MLLQSWTSCVQQYVDKAVGLCSPHNLHHTDHMKIDKQSTAPVYEWGLDFFGLISCSNFLLTNTGFSRCRVVLLLLLRSVTHLPFNCIGCGFLIRLKGRLIRMALPSLAFLTPLSDEISVLDEIVDGGVDETHRIVKSREDRTLSSAFFIEGFIYRR